MGLLLLLVVVVSVEQRSRWLLISCVNTDRPHCGHATLHGAFLLPPPPPPLASLLLSPLVLKLPPLLRFRSAVAV